MLINQTNKLDYINKLENENKLLREENVKLKRAFLYDKNYQDKEKQNKINKLENEVATLRHKLAFLLTHCSDILI